jgi:hypothetical protein
VHHPTGHSRAAHRATVARQAPGKSCHHPDLGLRDPPTRSFGAGG